MHDFKDPIPESLRKSLEINSRSADVTKPLLEQHEKIQGIANIAKPIVPGMMPPSSAIEAIKIIEDGNPLKHMDGIVQAQRIADIASVQTAGPMEIVGSSVLKFAGLFSNFQISSAAVETINTFCNNMNTMLVNSLRTMIGNMGSAIIAVAQSPMVQWLQSFDFTPFITMLEGLNLDQDLLKRYKELNEAYLKAMYECKWFPYAGWTVDISLFTTVCDIISTSRGASKRREKRIDAAIFSYYTNDELKAIKRDWKNSELAPHVKKILGQAIEAHLRGEYVLTISCLATMWEGMIKAKIAQNTKNQKADFKKLVDENGFEEVFSDFYNNMIISTCYSPEEVVEGVPNRHGVAHSWYVKYPNKKASLNAILLTDFIINLEAKENN